MPPHFSLSVLSSQRGLKTSMPSGAKKSAKFCLALGQLQLNQLLRHAADWQQTAARITHTTYRYNQHQQCWKEEIAQFEHITAAEWAKSLRLSEDSKWWH